LNTGATRETALVAALGLIGLGVPVFPLWGIVERDGKITCECGAVPGPDHREGKHPAVKHGHNDASLDQGDVWRWFDGTPKNLGYPTGAASGRVVLDFDRSGDGLDVADDFEAWTNGVTLPPTHRIRTGGGGLHLIYSLPADLRVRIPGRNRVLPGTDVKADGGYVAAPPSRHISGAWYEPLDDRPLTPLSGDLITWLLGTRGGSGGGGDGRPADYDFARGAVAGQRDAYFNDVAFRLRKLGLTYDRALLELRRAWDASEQPPDDPFTWEQALFKLDRVWRTVDAGPGVGAGATRWLDGRGESGRGEGGRREDEGTPSRGGAGDPALPGSGRPAASGRDGVGGDPLAGSAVVEPPAPGRDGQLPRPGPAGIGDPGEDRPEVAGGGAGDGANPVELAGPGDGGGGGRDGGAGRDGAARDAAGGGGAGEPPRAGGDERGDVRGPNRAEGITDTGNGRRFVRLHSEVARFVPEEGRWYVWDGRRLAPDALDRVRHLTLDVVDDLRVESLLPTTPQDDRQRLARWSVTSEAMARRNAMLDSAACDPAIATLVSDLDADPWILVTRNGTLDLREVVRSERWERWAGESLAGVSTAEVDWSGCLRESRAADLCTKTAAVEFDPGARCPAWDAHVELVTRGDPELAAYLRRMCGYSLTGLVSEQTFIFLHGTGQNGKNAFVETLVGMLGDYGQVAHEGLLTAQEEHPTALAQLRGARVVMADETRRAKFNDARLKMLTGSARVRARYMRQDFFEYDATMKLWILGNAKPTVSDTSLGMWRRLRLVPFTAVISEDRRVLHYDRVLRAEWPGILNWSLAGLADWVVRGGLGPPPAVRRATADYRSEEDVVGQFIAERCEVFPEARATVDELFTAYQLWCVRAGIKPSEQLNKITLGRDLGSRGFESTPENVDGRKVRVRAGIRLAPAAVTT